MIKRFATSLTLITVTAWASTVLAEKPPTPQYQVEMIIFETTALRGWTEEYWPWPDALKQPDPLSEAPETAPETQNPDFSEETLAPENSEKNAALKKGGDPLQPPDTLPTHTPADPEETAWSLTDILNGIAPVNAPFWISRITPVPPDEQLLTEALQKLKPEKGYRVITYLAWRQAAIHQEIAAPLTIDAVTETGEQLTGTVMFYKNRFAHVVVDLKLDRIIPDKIRPKFAQHEGLPLDALPESWPFYLKASRKVKSGTWYYIDHPIFGVLLTIQKLKVATQGTSTKNSR